MMERTIIIELTLDEVLALGNLVNKRMLYLALQPKTAENFKEAQILARYTMKALPQISAHARAQEREDKASQN